MPRLFSGTAALPFDAPAALARIRKDKPLARMMERIGPFGLQIQAMPSPFEALAESIIYQQLTGKAAATIHGRLAALSGADRFLTPGELLALHDDAIRGAGVSRPKLAALRDLAARADAGAIPTGAELSGMPDDEIVERLCAIRGIGRWTVEMLLIFNLGRPDVLPIDDYGVRKGFMRTFGTAELPKPRDVALHGEKWRPYRTVASWYLWRASELKDAPN